MIDSSLLRGGLLMAALTAASAPAAALCGCYCVDGVPRTLCSRMGEAREGAGYCAGVAPASCPAALDPLEPRLYDAPLEGAEDCRDARVWDADAAAYTTRKICELSGTG